MRPGQQGTAERGGDLIGSLQSFAESSAGAMTGTVLEGFREISLELFGSVPFLERDLPTQEDTSHEV
jgi:hypothetical protein